MKKQLLVFVALVFSFMFSADLSAQQIAATWALTNTTQNTVVTSGVITATDQSITGMKINGWSGNNTAAKLYSITGGTTQTGYWPNETEF